MGTHRAGGVSRGDLLHYAGHLLRNTAAAVLVIGLAIVGIAALQGPDEAGCTTELRFEVNPAKVGTGSPALKYGQLCPIDR